MNPTTFTFSQIAEILESAKIPCVLKQYRYEDGSTEFSVECGYNWPEQLSSDVYDAFTKAGTRVPRNLSLCAHTCGLDLIAQKKIAGGQRNYFHLERWG